MAHDQLELESSHFENLIKNLGGSSKILLHSVFRNTTSSLVTVLIIVLNGQYIFTCLFFPPLCEIEQLIRSVQSSKSGLFQFNVM